MMKMMTTMPKGKRKGSVSRSCKQNDSVKKNTLQTKRLLLIYYLV